MQPWHTPFPIWNQSAVPCPVLTVVSRPAYSFLRRQVGWSGIPISWRIFQFVVFHTVKVNKAEIDVLLCSSGILFFFFFFLMIQWMLAIWSVVPLPFLNPAWTSESSLLKPGLENFEHYFPSVWDEGNCVLVWTFFGIAFHRDWNEN